MRVGVLLAAGASTRMGHPKALARAGRESFLASGVRRLWAACDAVVIVLGSKSTVVRRHAELEFERLVSEGRLHGDLARARRHGARGLEAHFVVNRAWPKGMYSSVREGLKAARAFAPDAVLVLPVDHPDVRPATVALLAGLLEAAAGSLRSAKERRAFRYALVPRHRRRRGHPLALTPALAEAIARDARARDLSDAVRRNARLVGYVDVDDPGVVRNRNTPRD
uniref:MobA-like NTP transferase domain-containing protein n=1 Tax=Eiseniibacteriota bacterium TaxID=2212470 RepID=A0A832I9P2_UNCEI